MIAAGALALALHAPSALAQTAGDKVRITTDAGPLDGTLVDRLAEGYLVRFADGNRVVPYASVKSIVKIDASAGAQPERTPPPAPSEMPSSGTPTVVVLPPEPPAVPGPPGVYYHPQSVLVEPLPPRRYRGPTNGLVAGGTTLLGFGILGLLVGAVLSPVGHAIKNANTCHSASGTLTFDCEYGKGGRIALAGDITLIVGTVVMAGGIAMIVVGRTARTTVVSKLPSITVGTRGASLAWTF